MFPFVAFPHAAAITYGKSVYFSPKTPKLIGFQPSTPFGALILKRNNITFSDLYTPALNPQLAAIIQC